MKLKKPDHYDEEKWQQHLLWMAVSQGETKANIDRYKKEECKNGRRVGY